MSTDSELTSINADYVKENARKMTTSDVEKVAQNEKRILSLATGPLVKLYESIKLMLSLVKDYCAGRYTDVPWTTIGCVTFALLYVLSPIDIIPDMIPVVGLTDDALVVLICLAGIEVDLECYKAWRDKRS